MLCVEDVLWGVPVILENARVICCMASSRDCDIDRVYHWADVVPCTLGTDWVLFGFVVRTLGTMGWCYLIVQTFW